MKTIEQWRDEQEDNWLYKLSGEGESELKPFLEVGWANRILGVKLTRIQIVLRNVAKLLGDDWNWINEECDRVEDYQLTVGEPENSRSQYKDAYKFKQNIDVERGQGRFNLFGAAK